MTGQIVFGDIISEIGSPIVAEIHDYYQSKRRSRPMPARQDLDVLDIPLLMPHALMVDVLHDDFRFRLFGTKVVEIWGRDLTGRRLSELPALDMVRWIAQSYAAVRDRRQVLHDLVERPFGGVRSYERLLMPLSNDGRMVNIILAAVDYAGDEGFRPGYPGIGKLWKP
jgi:hypothetical protein